ncbi:MAG: sugar phosphate isomerase/epimerase [Akkermansiaceae bacterium]|nr:sugar phosphate isomerase/epimerase [Akkermansiaceae bacterium]
MIRTLASWILGGLLNVSMAAEVQTFAPKLYAFENGLSSLPPIEGVRLLKQLGYQGVGSVNTTKLAAIQAACNAEDFPLVSIYVGGRVNSENYELEAGLTPAIRSLKGSQAIVELFLQKGPQSTDAQAIAMVREVAEQAAAAGLRVVIYPHAYFHVERVDHALRIAKATKMDNVGVAFNLCHFLKTQPGEDLAKNLRDAAPRLWSVSLCGADRDGRDWGKLIRPLDEGDFDQKNLLDHFRTLGYGGSIGLQCYNIRIAPAEQGRNLYRI